MYQRRTRAEEAIEAVISARAIQQADEWYALRTPPMKEIDAGVLLHDLGFLVWCPMQTAWKRVGSLRIRHRATRLPAMVGYILVGLTRGDRDWLLLWRTGYVRGVVAVGDRPYAIPKGHVARLAKGQRGGAFDETGVALDASLREGDRVRVEEGPFRGHYVRVEAVAADRLKVLVDLFGRRHYVEMRLDSVSKAA